jgi:hypothetical protein
VPEEKRLVHLHGVLVLSQAVLVVAHDWAAEMAAADCMVKEDVADVKTLSFGDIPCAHSLGIVAAGLAGFRAAEDGYLLRQRRGAPPLSNRHVPPEPS